MFQGIMPPQGGGIFSGPLRTLTEDGCVSVWRSQRHVPSLSADVLAAKMQAWA
ncbi:hypothetical protein JZ751_025218 [Albula glossodonta]|uniref:Uncharacterized protein n=1 Tax=Albula glossodonta TaxID=121402 RepID=A0A8T2NMC8_9TELE|nr:hypothetical protein JZ751_025218 [Albula glossodonta]